MEGLSPVLAGRLVRLEPLRLAHAAELWPAADAEGLWRHMSRPVATPEALAAWIDDRTAGRSAGTALPFVQRRAATGEAVGCTALYAWSRAHRRIEVGHTWLAPAAQGTGINAEAKLLLLGHAFEVLGVERVQAKADAENHRARRALGRLGFTREGSLRRHMVRPDGTPRDTEVHAVLREDWPRVQAQIGSLLRDG